MAALTRSFNTNPVVHLSEAVFQFKKSNIGQHNN